MNYRLEDLLDIPLLQDLQERLNSIYSFPSAIIDNEGKILTAVAWQDLCTKFHRTNPESERECIKSDQYIFDHLNDADPAVSYECPHGMVDNAAPIIVDGMHLGNFFTGQFFLKKPDLEFFKAQAIKYGFDEKEYLEAVEKVPVWTKDRLALYLNFIKGFIEIIAGLGLKNLKEIEFRKEIRKTEDILKSYSDNSPMAVIEWDSEFIITLWTGNAEKMFGWKSDEVLGKKLMDLNIVYEPDIPVVEIIMEKLVAGLDDHFVSSNRNYRKDRGIITCEWYNTILKDENGKLISVLSQVLDITERVEAEEELTSQKHFFEQMFLQSSISTQILDHEGWCERINPKLSEIFGVKPEHIEGKVYNIFKDEGIKQGGVIPHLEKVFNEGKTSEWEVFFDIGIAADSQNIEVKEKKKEWYSNWAYPIFDKNGKLLHVIIQHTNITDRKSVEESLQKSELKYRSLIESSSDAIFCVDEKGEYQFTNQLFASTFGKTPDYFIGKTFWDIYDKEHADQRYEATKRLFKTGISESIEVEVPLPDKTLYFWATTNPIKDETGKVVLNLTHAADITQRKQAEEELKRQFNEMERFHNLTLDRELKMIELKKEINELLRKSGEKEKYKIVS